MRQAERLARFTAVLLLIYSLIVARGVFYVVHEERTAPEVFPFFVWELFSRVPRAERESYALRFVEVNGDPLDTPVYFEKAGAFLSMSHSPDAQVVIRQIGEALAAGQPFRMTSNRDILEARFMDRLTSAEYEIVRIRFDVLDRIDCDCFIQETPIAQFTLGE